MNPRYVRFTKLKFDPTNYAAMIDHRDNTIVPKLNEMQIPGLVRVRMIKVSDNEVITLAAYDTKENFQAAAPILDSVMAELSQWLTTPPERWVGELEDLYDA